MGRLFRNGCFSEWNNFAIFELFSHQTKKNKVVEVADEKKYWKVFLPLLTLHSLLFILNIVRVQKFFISESEEGKYRLDLTIKDCYNL